MSTTLVHHTLVEAFSAIPIASAYKNEHAQLIIGELRDEKKNLDKQILNVEEKAMEVALSCGLLKQVVLHIKTVVDNVAELRNMQKNLVEQSLQFDEKFKLICEAPPREDFSCQPDTSRTSTLNIRAGTKRKKRKSKHNSSCDNQNNDLPTMPTLSQEKANGKTTLSQHQYLEYENSKYKNEELSKGSDSGSDASTNVSSADVNNSELSCRITINRPTTSHNVSHSNMANELDIYMCTDCNEMFANMRELKVHKEACIFIPPSVAPIASAAKNCTPNVAESMSTRQNGKRNAVASFRMAPMSSKKKGAQRSPSTGSSVTSILAKSNKSGSLVLEKLVGRKRRDAYRSRTTSLLKKAKEIEILTGCKINMEIQPTWTGGKAHQYQSDAE